MKYRKKPVTIEAMQYTGENFEEIQEFMGEEKPIFARDYVSVVIRTLEGSMKAKVGDYIIKGVKGEFYPCRKDIFEQTYEKVDPNRQTKNPRPIDASELKRALMCDMDFGIFHAGRNGEQEVFFPQSDVLREVDDCPTIEPVKQEWIKVEDGTPEQFSSAIVFDGDAVGEAIYDGKRFEWVLDEDIAYATHWMPLPEPPKGSGEE